MSVDRHDLNVRAITRVQVWDSFLRKRISVPGALLFILLLGFLSGIGFYMKSAVLVHQLSSQEAEVQSKELQSLKMSNEWLKNRIVILQEEKAALLDNAVADLNNKSLVIKSILSSVGVDLQLQVSSENSGGPFTRYTETGEDELLQRTDEYLDAILNVPLGAPAPGLITSGFGRRTDPVNGEAAFHQGVDIRGRRGSEVKATANGTVIKNGHDNVRGRYLMIDHGNGFITKYLHLKKSLVKKGDSVERGQVIGLLGNSGRSTGPHVHYEIQYDNKIVNPIKFIKIAKNLSAIQQKQ
jgi:murein DD-endopeptidase MepM/ murein hydrolase activator NlpD